MQRPTKRRKYRAKFNDNKVRKSIIKDYEDGLALKDIEWRYGISKIGLKDALIRYGIYKQKRESRMRFTGIKRFNALVDYFNGMPIQCIIEKYKINKRTLYYTYDSLVLQKYEFKEKKLKRRKGFSKKDSGAAYTWIKIPEIVERALRNEKVTDIAKEYHITKSAIQTALYKYGVNIKECQSIARKNAIQELKNGGIAKEVAEKYHMTPSNLYRIFELEYGMNWRKYNSIKLNQDMWNRMEKFDFKSQNDRFWRLVRAKKAAKKKVTLEDLDRKGSY